MTVQELIDQLVGMPPNAIVVVRGYEDGVNEVDRAREFYVRPFSLGSEWYYGSFELAQNNGEYAVFLDLSRDDITE